MGKIEDKIDWSEIYKNNLWLDMGSDWAAMGDSFISQHTEFST